MAAARAGSGRRSLNQLLLSVLVLVAGSADAAWRCLPDASGSGWDCSGSGPAPSAGKGGPAKPPAQKATAQKAPAVVVRDQSGAAPTDAEGTPRGTVAEVRLPDWQPGTTAAELDWQTGGGVCRGSYQDPLDGLPDTSERALIVTESDLSELDLDEQIAELTGTVVVRQGSRFLSASDVQHDRLTGDFVLKSQVQLREPGMVLLGEQASFNLDGTATVREASFLIHEGGARGVASNLSRDEDGTLTVRDGWFTRCAPEDKTWSIGSRKTTIYPDRGYAVAEGAVLRVSDIPVLYAPYVRFPLNRERQSGFLAPSLGVSDEDGADVSVPYYFNLAPNYDATVTPRYMSKRGGGFEAEVRHLSERTRSDIGIAFLADDDRYNGKLDIDDFEQLFPGVAFDSQDRWLINADHRGQLGPVSTRIDYNAVSDDDYFGDLGTNLGVSSRDNLHRLGEVVFHAPHWQVSARAEGFQNLNDRPDSYQLLPQLALLHQGDVSVLHYELMTEATSFERSEDPVLQPFERVTGERLRAQPALSVPLDWRFGFLHPEVAYKYASYRLNDQLPGLDDSPDYGVFSASVDAGLFFEREIRDGRMVQTLEPRLFYVNTDLDEQSAIPLFDSRLLDFGYAQLFRPDRFSGGDRVGDANQLTVALQSQLLDTGTGRPLLRIALGQVFFFEDRVVTLRGATLPDARESTSALASLVQWNVGEYWSVSGELIWDSNNRETDQGRLDFRYNREGRYLFNVGYRYRDDSQVLEQYDVNFAWNVSERWKFFGRYNWDRVGDRLLEGFAGVEYDHCCWRTRVVWRRFLKAPEDIRFAREEEGLFIQIVLKGLASAGANVDDILANGIIGFSEPRD